MCFCDILIAYGEEAWAATLYSLTHSTLPDFSHLTKNSVLWQCCMKFNSVLAKESSSIRELAYKIFMTYSILFTFVFIALSLSVIYFLNVNRSINDKIFATTVIRLLNATLLFIASNCYFSIETVPDC